MPVQLTTAQYVSLGDIAWPDRTALTVALTITPAGTLATERHLLTQWGLTALNQGFILQVFDTDEIEFVVSGESGYFGRKTTSLNMVTGSTYRIVAKWRANGGGVDEIQIFVNGVEHTPLGVTNNVSNAAFNDVTATVDIGMMLSDSSPAQEGAYRDIAAWASYLDDAECVAISNCSVSPTQGATGVFYVPANNSLVDVWGGATLTHSYTALSAHTNCGITAGTGAFHRMQRRTNMTAF